MKLQTLMIVRFWKRDDVGWKKVNRKPPLKLICSTFFPQQLEKWRKSNKGRSRWIQINWKPNPAFMSLTRLSKLSGHGPGESKPLGRVSAEARYAMYDDERMELVRWVGWGVGPGGETCPFLMASICFDRFLCSLCACSWSPNKLQNKFMRSYPCSCESLWSYIGDGWW